VIYGACFGMELTIDNIAALYLLSDYFFFKMDLQGRAGILAWQPSA
jgi:hypothetical protein